MKPWIRIFFLLLINITMAGSILYLLDYMEIINYNKLFTNIFEIKMKFPAKIEDPLMLEKEELNKKWELLSIKEIDLSNQAVLIATSNISLETDKAKLYEEREAFLNEQILIEIKKEEKNNYNLKIADVATQIIGMPPQTAAEILNLQEDLQVVDIFKKMDELATKTGQASTVPFLLTLLEREKAARVQTLMLVSKAPSS